VIRVQQLENRNEGNLICVEVLDKWAHEQKVDSDNNIKACIWK